MGLTFWCADVGCVRLAHRSRGGDDAVRVFMSYRRTDDANFTGRFHDKLIGVFGDANVFRDIDSIPAGTRFEDVINARLADVDAVVALIGSTWAGRIDASSDFVRMEIAHALQSGTPVIPVLIEDTAFPTPDALPDDLKPMLDRQTVRVRRDPDFHRDAARVIDGVREAVAVQARAGRSRPSGRRVGGAGRARGGRTPAGRDSRTAESSKRNSPRANARAARSGAPPKRSLPSVRNDSPSWHGSRRRPRNDGSPTSSARVAEIVESQAARERDAEAAAAHADGLRRELEGGPPAGAGRDGGPTASEHRPDATGDAGARRRADPIADRHEAASAPGDRAPGRRRAVAPVRRSADSRQCVDGPRWWRQYCCWSSPRGRSRRCSTARRLFERVRGRHRGTDLSDDRAHGRTARRPSSSSSTEGKCTPCVPAPPSGYIAYVAAAPDYWSATHYYGRVFPNKIVVHRRSSWPPLGTCSAAAVRSPAVDIDHTPSRYRSDRRRRGDARSRPCSTSTILRRPGRLRIACMGVFVAAGAGHMRSSACGGVGSDDRARRPWPPRRRSCSSCTAIDDGDHSRPAPDRRHRRGGV